MQGICGLVPDAAVQIIAVFGNRCQVDDAEEAAEKLTGEKRLASERDSTVTIYNLFGIPSWGNFHRLGMYRLGELKSLLARRTAWQQIDQANHAEIIAMLETVAKNYGIEVPSHWY